MESIYYKNNLLTLSLLTLLFLNSAEVHCVRRNSAPSPDSDSPLSAPSPGSDSPSSSPLPSQSTPSSASPPPTESTSPTSSISAPESTPSSSSPPPTESTSPTSSISAPESTPSSSSPPPTESTSPTSSISAPKSSPSESTPSSSSLPPTESSPPTSSISAPESNPSFSSPSPTQSTSPTSSISVPESNPSSSSPPPTESTPPVSSISAPESTPWSSSPSPAPSTTAQPPPTTQTLMMDGPDGEVPTKSSPTTSTPSMTMMDSPDGEVPTSSDTGAAPTHGLLDLKTSANAGSNDAIKKICDQTDHVPLCLESISPLSNGQTDVLQVLSIAVNASYAQTEAGMKALDEAISKPGTPADLVSALNDCKENFGDALDNLKAAQGAIVGKDIGTIQTMLSAALTDYGTCTDGMPGVNPLQVHTEKLNNMASNCLAIAALHK